MFSRRQGAHIEKVPHFCKLVRAALWGLAWRARQMHALLFPAPCGMAGIQTLQRRMETSPLYSRV